MSKVLFISNISHKINSFAVASISAAHDIGVDFYHVSNWGFAKTGQIQADEVANDIKIKSVCFSRKPFALANIAAYKELIRLIRQENIDFIHCNTPTGGLLGRLAGKRCKVKKVIYQAHGFHFWKGAPLKNWLLYYPVEKWLSRYTDALVTINREDYALAKKKMRLRKGGNVYYVPGVGVDLSQYGMADGSREYKRRELNLQAEEIAVISMGDLAKGKNYETAIRAIAEANNDNLHYYICGKGPEEERLKDLAKQLNIASQIHFLGYRNDIKELLAAADVFLFTSRREGLSRSLMEAMASGLPCVVSRIRGNTDLLEDAEGGYLCDVDDVAAYAQKLNCLASDAGTREKMGKNNLRAIQGFSHEIVANEMKKIYRREFT